VLEVVVDSVGEEDVDSETVEEEEIDEEGTGTKS
jgi:hypothetical protein